MKSRLGRKGTVLAAVALAATAVAGGALAAIAAHGTTTTTKITATETNYKITLSRNTAPVGTIAFTVHNSSKTTAHKFGVKGNGISKSITGYVNPGQTKLLTVTLPKGTYTVYCALHASMGMKTTLKVGSGTGTTTTKTTTTSTWG